MKDLYTLGELKKKFLEQVSIDNVQWDHDNGHAYSYLEGVPVMELFDSIEYYFTADEVYEWADFCNKWLYEHDDNSPGCVHGGNCGCEPIDDTEGNDI